MKNKAVITKEDLDRLYLAWGWQYDPAHCGESVYRGGYWSQCSAKAKPSTLWCGRHSLGAEAKREAKRAVRAAERTAVFKQQRANAVRSAGLAQIAPELAAALSAMLRRDVFSARQSALSALDRYEEIVGKEKP